jgi:hypothetical protein
MYLPRFTHHGTQPSDIFDIPTIPILAGRKKDPKTSGLTASFEVIFVALNNLTLLILSSI